MGSKQKNDPSRKKRQMQYTESVVDCLKEIAQNHSEAIDWQSACEDVKDPRRKQGKRFSITSILLLALAAILSNHVSELAIAEWGAGQSAEGKKALGFEKGVTPHQTTIQRLFRRLSAEEIEDASRRIFLQTVNKDQEERGACAVSIDGKAQRGRLKFEEKNGYPVHAVSIVAHQTGIVLTQGHVEKADVETQSKLTDEEAQEEKKQKSELAVASRLIQQIDWKGKVLTGDALYCQRGLCGALRQAGGDYLFLVKGNQPLLLEDLRLLFAPPASAKRAGEGILRLPEQQAQTTEKGHGRLDIRSIRVSSELKGSSDWPGLEQVFEIRRCWQSKGVWKEAVRYGVTSLPAAIAIPERLLKLKRGHWIIENGLHYVKDVTLGEDKSTIHADNGPKIMAALRNTAISLLRHAGFSSIAARMRYNSTHPQAALEVLSLSFENA
ncbi:MAG: ISAs1 family transposase [Rhabdochlamydiaceae bacterium]